MRIASIALALVVVTRTSAVAQTRMPVQAERPGYHKPVRTPHTVVRVSQLRAKQPNEVSVAINLRNPDHVVAVAMQRGGIGQSRVTNVAYMSGDGGKTWRTVQTPNPDRRTQGDDAIAVTADGTFVHTYIAFNGLRVRRPLRASNGIFSSTSRDGLKWNKPVPIVDHINATSPFEDKPYLGVDISSTSPHRGNIYVAWTKFDVYGSRESRHQSSIYFSRSRDGAKTYSPAIRISDKPGNARDGDGTVEGCVPAVGPKGEVYVSWAGPRGIEFDKSTDGGWSFGKDKTIAKTPGGWDIPIAGIARHNGMPCTGVDVSRGPNRGSVYVAWIDERNKDPDVFLIASRDGGKTWSRPKRVNSDKRRNGKAQFFAWMAVDPVDGSINIAFFDRRDHTGTRTGLILARSVDGGRTFVNHRINQKPFDCNRRVFFGDYIGIAAVAGRVVVLYPHFTGRNTIAISAARFQFGLRRQTVAR